MAKSQAELIEELMIAAREDDLEAVQECVEKLPNGVDTQNGEGCTALIMAANQGNREVVEWLLKQKADPNIQDETGETALICAAKEGYVDVVRTLLKHGADPLLPDEDGSTALDRTDTDGIEKLLQMAEDLASVVEWARVGSSCIAHTQGSIPLQRKLTEIFNFSTRLYTITTENMRTGAETTSDPLDFSELPEESLVEAFENFTALGGKTRKDFVLNGTRRMTDKPALPSQKKKPGKS